MKFNTKNKDFINVLVVVFIFVFYKSFPVKIQVFLPLILSVYFVINIGILIHQRRYWEEILRNIILFVAAITLFVFLYNSAFKFNNYFMKIALLVIGWMFPCLAYTGVVSWKRKDNIRKYKQCLFFLVYCILLAIFCTVIVIVK